MTPILAELSRQLGAQLMARKAMIATVESCTGGEIAHSLSSIPGASRWFDCAWITYSNESKIQLLDIPASLIAAHGAVSAEVALAMVSAGLYKSRARFCISVTGIAGPDGGTPNKPVGTVFFGFAAAHHRYTQHRVFAGDREHIRNQSTAFALEEMLKLSAI